jgi:TonB family protein
VKGRRTVAGLALGALLAGAPARAGTPGEEIDAVPARPSPELRLEEIRARVQAAVVYPDRARERGLEGVAHIQFRIDAGGRAADVETFASSGHRLLDRAAEQAARDAGLLPAIYGWIRVPVRFSLSAAGPATDAPRSPEGTPPGPRAGAGGPPPG